MRNGYERDGPRRRRLLCRRRRLQRLELASGWAVENVPAAGAQLFADRIGRFEVALAPPLDAFGQELFCF